MGHNLEMNHLMLVKELIDYNGFTVGEKKYCIENISAWFEKEKGVDTMIEKLAEKSLDARPFLSKVGLLSEV